MTPADAAYLAERDCGQCDPDREEECAWCGAVGECEFDCEAPR